MRRQFETLLPEILFIGEGPGQKEDELGSPFVGAAGKFLQLYQPVQSRDVRDTQPGQIGVVERPVRSPVAGVTRRQQVACRPGQEQVLLRIAARFDETAGGLERTFTRAQRSNPGD